MRGRRRQLWHFAGAVGTRASGEAGQVVQGASEVRIAGKAPGERAFPRLEAAVSQPGDLHWHIGRHQRRIEGPPDQQVDKCHERCNEQRAGPANGSTSPGVRPVRRRAVRSNCPCATPRTAATSHFLRYDCAIVTNALIHMPGFSLRCYDLLI